MATRKPAHNLITVSDLKKEFPTADGHGGVFRVLRGLDLTIRKGEVLAIVGASGAGKSTLLHILGTLDRPTSGSVLCNDEDVFSMSDEELARFRNRQIGFVFQFHHLLPEFTALENVAMPALISGQKLSSVRQRAAALLHEVGLSARVDQRPTKLSGGEQQRVAVARALMNSPAVVLADEPSGNLDSGNARNLHRLLWTLSRTRGQTVVVVTHNESLAKQADRAVRIVDGVIERT